MTARLHVLWVQELLASRGIVATVDDATPGALTLTCGAKSRSVTATDLITRNLYELADELQAGLTP